MIPKENGLDPKRVASVLKKVRSKEGLTQTAFAAKHNVDVDVYRTWEAGRSIPKVYLTQTFLKLLGHDGRKKLDLHLGLLIDEIRGVTNEDRATAFDALAIILEDAPENIQKEVREYLADKAGKHGKK